MNNSERRKNGRPQSLNLLDFVVVDSKGRHGEYTMARTLNVSKGGILMETHLKLDKGQQVMLTLELKNSLVNIMGKIVYSAFIHPRYRYGIEFFYVSEADQKLLDAYVDAFQAFDRFQHTTLAEA